MLGESAVLTLCSHRMSILSHNAFRVNLLTGLQALVVCHPVLRWYLPASAYSQGQTLGKLYSPASLSPLTFRNTTLIPLSWKGVRKGDATPVTVSSLISPSLHGVFYLRLIPVFKNHKMCLGQCGSVCWALSTNQKVAGLIPGQGTCVGCWFGPQLGCLRKVAVNRCFSSSLSSSLPLLLKIK